MTRIVDGKMCNTETAGEVNRCLYVITDGEQHSPVIYEHCAASVSANIAALRSLMEGRRYVDVDYAAARLISILAKQNPGPDGVGVMNIEADILRNPEDYSHGDEGVVIIDCETWAYTRAGQGRIGLY